MYKFLLLMDKIGRFWIDFEYLALVTTMELIICCQLIIESLQ